MPTVGAAYCPKVPLDDRERLHATEDVFATHGVVIAEADYDAARDQGVATGARVGVGFG